MLLVSCTPSGTKPIGDETIVLVSRQNNSGTYVYFREEVLGEGRDFRQGTLDQSGSNDVVTLVGNTPSAIGYSGMAYVTPAVKLLHVSKKKGEAGIAPTVENARTNKYPISRPLFCYTNGEPKGAAKAYIEWILAKEGQDVVTKEGYVPLTDPAASYSEPPAGKSTVKVSGSDTMVNLAQKWAEEYMKKYPDVSVQVSGGGSGVGIGQLTDGVVDIANASRKMKPGEQATAQAKNGVAPKEFFVGQDALGVYVHKDNPLTSISVEEISEIYGEGGTITKWSQIQGWPAGK
jgi:ABC-type phosphate transport system substrate-binding protein